MSRIPLLLALAMLVTVVAVAAGVALSRPSSIEPVEIAAAKAPAQPPLVELVEISAAAAPVGPPPVELLRTWDVRRAQAWARGDPRLLRALYTPESLAGRRDLSMLRAWTARGLVVRRLRTQLLSVRELSRRRSARTLLVTDRLVGGVAVGAGVRRRLPTDRATTRTIRFLRSRGEWLVAWVQPGEVS